MEPPALNLSTQFEVAKYTRIIEATTNVAELQEVALKLLQAWAVQKATTAWVIRDALGAPPKVTPESLNREV